jgi:hypothetical protein
MLETMSNAEEKLAVIELHYGNNKAEKGYSVASVYVW